MGHELADTTFVRTAFSAGSVLLRLQVQAYEIPQIAAAVAELSATDEIPITYMVVRKRHNTRYGWLATDCETDSGFRV